MTEPVAVQLSQRDLAILIAELAASEQLRRRKGMTREDRQAVEELADRIWKIFWMAAGREDIAAWH